VKDKFRYIVVGSLDAPEALPPKGEFFCKERVSWMPEVPSTYIIYIHFSVKLSPRDKSGCADYGYEDVFHKKEIKE
jgi:hypothetical protein